MGIQEKTPPDFAALREEARRIGRRRDLVFRILVAGVAGSLLSVVSFFSFLVVSHAMLGEERRQLVVLFIGGISWFLGGLKSGSMVEFEVRHRRWRFLWLALASPATSAWLYGVWVATTQRHISDFHAILLTIMFLSSLAGVAAGYRAAYRYRMRERRTWADRSDDRNGPARRTEG
jgi:hypothetical protein